MTQTEMNFNGPCYDPQYDQARLSKQIVGIYNLMTDNQWRTLDEIHYETGYPQASISAQLRNLKKVRFGSHLIMKRHRGERSNGLWEYKMIS